MTTQQVF